MRHAGARRAGDYVSGADWVGFFLTTLLDPLGSRPELECSDAVEDHEDLLVRRVAMRRRARAAFVEETPIQSGAFGACFARKRRPATRVALILELDLVETDDR